MPAPFIEPGFVEPGLFEGDIVSGGLAAQVSIFQAFDAEVTMRPIALEAEVSIWPQ